VTLFPVSQIVLSAVVAGAGAAGALAVWPWARRAGRFAVAGISTTAGFVAWNLTLNATHAAGFNTDAPGIGVSWADAGSGVVAFFAVALALGLVTRREPAGRVVGAAVIAGGVALVVDLFVL